MFLTVGLFAFVWGAKLAVIDRYGSDLAIWDQWDAEGAALFVPWREGNLTWYAFFRPHNEHRIAVTRALALGLLAVNGQWDARLECVVNAALHAALAVALYWWGRGLLRRRIAPDATHRLRWCAHAIWLLTVAVLFAAPIAWANVISGFHSQQYFLLWFSLGAIALLPTATAFSLRWFGGLACAILALFSMGSGLLAAVAAGVACAVDGPPRAAWRKHRATILACAGVLALGLWLHVEEPANTGMRAQSMGEFFAALWRYFTWPFERLAGPREVRMPVLPWLVWLPWAWIGLRLWRERPAPDPRERVLFAAGGWVLLQFVASAYARGHGTPWPPSRYIDTLVVGFLVGALASLLLLAQATSPPARMRRVGIVIGGVAAILVTAGITAHVLFAFLHELPAEGARRDKEEANVRAYLASGDTSHLATPFIPYPDPHTLRQRLDDPHLRAILPVSVQPEPQAAPPALLSRGAAALARAGFLLGASGALVVLVAFLREHGPGRPA